VSLARETDIRGEQRGSQLCERIIRNGGARVDDDDESFDAVLWPIMPTSVCFVSQAIREKRHKVIKMQGVVGIRYS
jgi:hypothetical protein